MVDKRKSGKRFKERYCARLFSLLTLECILASVAVIIGGVYILLSSKRVEQLTDRYGYEALSFYLMVIGVVAVLANASNTMVPIYTSETFKSSRKSILQHEKCGNIRLSIGVVLLPLLMGAGAVWCNIQMLHLSNSLETGLQHAMNNYRTLKSAKQAIDEVE